MSAGPMVDERIELSGNGLENVKFLYGLIYRTLGADVDKINGVYDGSVPRNEKTREAVRERIRAIVASATGRVLDVGCSGGIVSVLMARKGCQVSGIDLVSESLAQAGRLWEAESKDVQTRLYFEPGLAEYLEFPDWSFDTVVMGQVLEHVISPRIVLRETMRVLKTGGKLLASVPIGYNKTALHLRFFEQGTFYKLLDEFVKVSEIKIFNKQMLAICHKE